MKRLSLLLLIFLFGCTGKPDNIKPVENFQSEKYLGKWYEIARINHRFEKGLSKVTAEYSLRDGGGIKVVNRGYSAKDQQWRESVGKAFFVEDEKQAFLKVSFFGPFYGSYIVFELEQDNYQYALVSGPDKSYFWLLSRTPKMDAELQKSLIDKAVQLGFDRQQIILVEQD
ncbi:MAG: lipocalin family protein [Arenimonas sp.]|nr:lipocalin family protein [Arenimonas sp.]